MRKLLIFIFSVIGVALILFAVLFTLKAKFLSFVLSRQLKTPVEITSIEFSQNRIEVYGLKILTPSDSVFEEAFSMEYLRIQAGILDLLRNTRQIREIFISNIKVNINLYNSSGTKSNWSEILDHMKDESKDVNKKDTQQEAKFVIQDLNVQNAQLSLKRLNQNITEFPNISIRLQNLGSDDPLSLTELIRLIVAAVVRELTIKYGLQKLFDNVLKQIPEKGLKGLKETFKGFKKNVPFLNKSSSIEEFSPEPIS
ncbi:MAG: hypothetical protein K940chlam8_01174 [Chlamydiae bacterium]|nr:hypothetical protein [Chlamydiota bacterium]